jgi:hypothetical protein
VVSSSPVTLLLYIYHLLKSRGMALISGRIGHMGDMRYYIRNNGHGYGLRSADMAFGSFFPRESAVFIKIIN